MMFIRREDGTDETSCASACAMAERRFSLASPPYSSLRSMYVLHACMHDEEGMSPPDAGGGRTERATTRRRACDPACV